MAAAVGGSSASGSSSGWQWRWLWYCQAFRNGQPAQLADEAVATTPVTVWPVLPRTPQCFDRRVVSVAAPPGGCGETRGLAWERHPTSRAREQWRVGPPSTMLEQSAKEIPKVARTPRKMTVITRTKCCTYYHMLKCNKASLEKTGLRSPNQTDTAVPMYM